MWHPKTKSFDHPVEVKDLPEGHPVSLFHSYWQELCGKRKFALKADFNPARVPGLLANIAITRLDYAGPEFDIHLKLAGERIKEILSIKGKGTYRNDYFSGDALADRLFLYDHMARKQLVKFFRMTAPFTGREFIEYIVGLFPFSNDGEHIDHFFLVIETI